MRPPSVGGDGDQVEYHQDGINKDTKHAHVNQRQGQHGEFGEVTVLQQASYFAKHDQSHLPQLDAIRRVLLGQ